MPSGRFALLIALAACVPVAPAAVVTTNADAGPGSLRDAIANASAGDTITFDPAGLSGGQTISLTSGHLAPAVNVTISGAGAPAVTIVNATGRVFNFENPTPTAVTLDNLTLQGTAPTDGNTGGAIRVGLISAVTLSVSHSTVSGTLSLATRGGAIALNPTGATILIDHSSVSGTVSAPNAVSNNAGGAIYIGGGTMRVTNSTIAGSVTGAPAGKNEGGAIAVYGGALTLTDSTITGGSADVGGGVFLQTGSLAFSDTTVSNNTAATSGGGIHVGRGTATLTNVTISGNTAPIGGGLYADFYSTNSQSGTATTTLTNCTIANNAATMASALYVGFRKPQFGTGSSNVTTLKNTLISGTVERQLSADITDTNEQFHASYSLFDANPTTGPGGTINGTNTMNLFGANPQLGALQNNGGATQTQALGATSAALDGGDTATCPATDQRGELRFGVCDIGAYEDQGDRLFANGFE